MIAIERLWTNLKIHEGETFETITGKLFRYKIIKNAYLQPFPGGKPTNRLLPKTQFENVLRWLEHYHVALSRPSQLQEYQGYSYVFALLKDKRIIG